jgi:hypothetical protein
MKKYMEEVQRIPVADAVDVIIAGGGIAGIAAALSAARHGLQVLLMEKSAMLGGLATLGLINWYEPLCDGDGRLMTTGIAEELLKLSIAYGYDNLPTHWGGSGNERDHDERRYATVFNPSVFSLALNELMLQKNIACRYDLLASNPVMEGETCKGIIAESKSGRVFYPASVVVDATGDADILFRAGVPCRSGKNYLTYIGHGCNFSSLQKAQQRGDMVWLNAPGFSAGSDLNGNGHPEGMPVFEGISGELVSNYLQQGQSLLFHKLMKKPWKEQCLYTLPGIAQLRTTRCLRGESSFLGTDGKHEEDSIGTVGDFRHRSRHYELSAECLYHPAYPNLLAAGRIVSAEGDGWEITRVIPTAALTGQACGVFAMHMVQANCAAAAVDVGKAQSALMKDGVRLHFD